LPSMTTALASSGMLLKARRYQHDSLDESSVAGQPSLSACSCNLE
jgi:hypothetical protein